MNKLIASLCLVCFLGACAEQPIEKVSSYAPPNPPVAVCPPDPPVGSGLKCAPGPICQYGPTVLGWANGWIGRIIINDTDNEKVLKALQDDVNKKCGLALRRI